MNACPQRIALAAFGAVLLATGGLGAPSAAAEWRHGIAMHGGPKLASDDTHLPYADPDAPKGGTLHRVLVGTFDSLNPFIVRGQPAAGLGDLYFPALMARSWDEPFTMYGYVAEAIDTPPDRGWVAFRLNPAARWHDGTPITVDDVIYSMETHREKGTPGKRRIYGYITEVERIGDHSVRFVLGEGADRETPLILALMPIISKSYYSAQPFEETSLDIPLGAGPYRIADVEPGRHIVYRRIEDWWGAELPAFRGQHNFDTHRFDFYRDETAALQAFSGGAYNYRLEFNAERWRTAYDFPAVRDGRVTLLDTAHGRAQGMRGFAFNTRRAVFADRRVREALTYAFDFEWVNRSYLYGEYDRIDSFFANSSMASSGLPEGQELAILDRFRDRLPASIFTEPNTLPSTDGSGNIRRNLREAGRLLDAAGWVIRDGKRVEAATGRPLAFEILLRDAGDERIALSFAENLARLGVEAGVRTVDSAQYTARTDTYDFDMVIHRWGVSLSPGAEQVYYWGSASADTTGTRNYPGVRDPVVDALAAMIADAIDREALEAATRALDRVLLAGHYVVPLYFTAIDHIAYWGDLGYADHVPLYGHISAVDAWWSNE